MPAHRQSGNRFRHRALGLWLLVASAAAAPAALEPPPARAAAPATPVSVYPSPGDRYEQPATQITFRGIPATAIGAISVVGSKTGVHTGRIAADSDGDGGSFIPDAAFATGETVTVSTGLDIVGGTGGSFRFQIERPGPNLVPERLPVASATDDVQRFHTMPGFSPAVLRVTRHSAPPDGDIFLAPQYGPTQNGPMILDPLGNLVWFDPIPISDETIVTDFRTQELYGQPVLTWFQGTTTSGTGDGVGIIDNDHYQQIAVVRAGNGLRMDLHEFLVTNTGDAYLIAVAPVEVPGVRRPVLNSVVQEVDIATGLVLFQWDALDHLDPATTSYTYGAKVSGHVLDPYHANSVSLDAQGNPVVSLRNTDAVYGIDRYTGAIVWELGGRHSSFTMGAGTATAFQHDAVVQPDGLITMFDDGAGPPAVHSQSRGIEVAIDGSTRRATLVRQVTHTPALLADFEGSVQALPGGEWFVGWGQQPYFSEFDAAGHEDFDARFVAPTASYRAYRLPWTGLPLTQPALAAGIGAGGAGTVWASWNGATAVSSWRVLAGPSAGQLAWVGQYVKHHFESTLPAGTGLPYVQAQALNAAGQVIGSSAVGRVPEHVQIFGSQVLVPAGGFAAVPVGCYADHPCHLVATVGAGGRVWAKTSGQSVGPRGGALLYFRLSPAARRAVAAAGHRNVTITLRDLSGAGAASADEELSEFSTRGAGPPRSIHQTGDLQILATSDFVSSATGLGSVIAECDGTAPCAVTTTVSAGGATVAATHTEYIGPEQVGYVLFRLSLAGRTLLSRAAGNQLAATVSITGPGLAASSQGALIAYR